MRYEDIHLEDATLYHNFQQFVSLGNYASALQLLENSQFDNKKVVAEVFNDLMERIYGTENIYYVETDQYMQQLIQNMQTAIDDLNYVGTYNNTVAYKERNFVEYNGNIYYCLQDTNAGTAPTNTSFWMLLGLKGKDGLDGLTNITFKGLYSATETYNTNDVVYVGRTFYYAKQSSTGQEIGENEYWGIFIIVKVPYILTQAELPEPDELISGDFYFQII